MSRTADLYAPIAEPLGQVRRLLDEELSSDLPIVRDLGAHVRGYRGKMIRPALVLLSGQACGAVRREHVVLAAVVELVHMATLVHDDVLDDSRMRRRLPTVNHLRGNEAAVLLGDVLISRAFHLCSTLESTYAARLIGSTTNTICEGELLQVHHRGNLDLTAEEYFGIVARKTASLMSTCCVLGARYAGADAAAIARLETYGMDAGMAFQIVDDVLDIGGSEEQMGKTLGRDIEKGELTLPVIHFLAHAPAERRREARRALSNGTPDRTAILRRLLDGSESLRYAMDVAARYARSARAALAGIPEGPARRSLEAIAEFVVSRTM